MFATDLECRAPPFEWVGPWREPVQMLAQQSLQGGQSVHDDLTAKHAGFEHGPIEGPTHFTQFEPLGWHFWGRQWFESGSISSHFHSPCYAGETVRPVARLRASGGLLADVELRKPDDSLVLKGTISTAGAGPTHVQERLASLRPARPLKFLEGVLPGARIERHPVRIDSDSEIGPMYPFSLREKLSKMTELSPWFSSGREGRAPWGGPILPFEMISILMLYTYGETHFPVRGRPLALFADQEIGLRKGPVFVGQTYEVEREVIALSTSARSEGLWIRSRLLSEGGCDCVAEMILNIAHLEVG